MKEKLRGKLVKWQTAFSSFSYLVQKQLWVGIHLSMTNKTMKVLGEFTYVEWSPSSSVHLSVWQNILSLSISHQIYVAMCVVNTETDGLYIGRQSRCISVLSVLVGFLDV